MKTWADFNIDVPSGATGEIDLPCPECSSTRKKRSARCLSINVDKGTFVCFHCGWSGGLGSGASTVDPGWRKPTYRQPSDRPMLDIPEALEKWFAGRGIKGPTLFRRKIAYAQVYMPQLEDTVGAVVFPYFRKGEIVNRKYRDKAKNFRMEPGAERILYGIDDITHDRLVFCEGELDSCSIEEAGIRSVVSVPDGAPAPGAKDYASKFSFLESAAADLAPVRKFVLAVDADEPGRMLEAELARRLGPEKCARVVWPDDIKDANECLMKLGAIELRRLIDAAIDIPIQGVHDVASMTDRIAKRYEHGYERGVTTGWAALDALYKPRVGELTIIHGIPGSGKSNIVDCLLVNLAKAHGWRFAMFSPENAPIEDHAGSLAEKYIGRPFDEGPRARMSPKELGIAMAFLDEHFTWIMPHDDADWSIDNILAKAESLCLKTGIKGLVIDPWNDLEPNRPQGLSETEYISASLRRVRRFARERRVHVWVVAHPTKLIRDKEGKYPIPTLYDISGSSAFRNRADNGICVWRDLTLEDSAEVQIHVQKIRFRAVGHRGMARLYYEPVCATYSEHEYFADRSA